MTSEELDGLKRKVGASPLISGTTQTVFLALIEEVQEMREELVVLRSRCRDQPVGSLPSVKKTADVAPGRWDLPA